MTTMPKILILIAIMLITSTPYTNAYANKTCPTLENLTEGPYYLPSPNREKLNIKEKGQNIEINLIFLDKSCNPLISHKVSLWQTNALGEYSTTGGAGLLELRGYQITDKKGKINFKTIFPGWYPGRTPHLHIKVTDKKNKVLLTSQLFFPQSIIESTYKLYPYSVRGEPNTLLSKDFVYSSIKNKTRYMLNNNSKNSFSKQVAVDF